MAEAWQQHPARHRTAAEVGAAVGLTERDVETALGYWAEFRDEIDVLVQRHHIEQDEALVAWEQRRTLDAL